MNSEFRCKKVASELRKIEYRERLSTRFMIMAGRYESSPALNICS